MTPSLLAACIGLAACGRCGYESTIRPDASIADGGPASTLCDSDRHPGLVACYAFEDDVDDGSANGLDATVTGASFEAGVDGQAIRVGGTTMLRVPDDARLDLGQSTIELWLRPDAHGPGDQNLLDNYPQYELELTSGGRLRARYFIDGSNQTLVSDAAAPIGEWTHVAITYDGADLSFYVDGAADQSGAHPGATDTGGMMGTWIGRDHEGGEALSGLIDNLRFFDRARDPVDLCIAAGRTGC